MFLESYFSFRLSDFSFFVLAARPRNFARLHPKHSTDPGMSGRKEAIALYDYQAKTAEELTLKKNDRLRLLEEDQAKLDAKNWWDVENELGQVCSSGARVRLSVL